MKRMILVCWLCLAATSVHAADGWLADRKTECNIWIYLSDASISDFSITWDGGCENGKASGKGKLTLYKKEKIWHIFEGMIEEGLKQGKGKIIFSSGVKYIGDFKDGRVADGEAEVIFPENKDYTELNYTGDFKDGKFDGSGTMLYKSGDKYSGGWSQGKQHGKGTYTFKDGTSYEGLWEHGERIKIF